MRRLIDKLDGDHVVLIALFAVPMALIVVLGIVAKVIDAFTGGGCGG